MLLFICSTLTAAAQNNYIHNPSITIKNDKLKVDFTLNIKPMSCNAMLIFTPILESDSIRKPLKPITIIGRNMRISMQRKNIKLPPNAIIKFRKTYNYSTEIPFENWTNKTALKVSSKIIACNNTTTFAEKTILTRNLTKSNQKSHTTHDYIEVIKQYRKNDLSEVEKQPREFSFVLPMEQYKPLTFNLKSLQDNGPKLLYRVNESEIDPNYNSNNEALMAIKGAIQFVSSNDSIAPAKIIIYGTASPEGSEDTNKQLAQARADWMVDYMKSEGVISAIETINLGENWDGLRELVEQSGMPYKQEVLGIIDNYSVTEGRKQKLMDIHVGIPYRYIKEQFYPQLRSALYIQIFYDTK